MAQSTAPREEPSMEDILSSIRRIIQSTDNNQIDNNQIDNSQIDNNQIESGELLATARDAPDVSVPRDAPLETTSLPHAPAPVSPVPSTDTQNYPGLADRIQSINARHEAKPAMASEHSKQDVEQNLDERPVATEQDHHEQVNGVPALISSGSHAKVVASFSQLNEAFSASSTKPLEDITNDMLQPMLKEWLDNNLPGLVERLVREEIERVARGGHES